MRHMGSMSQRIRMGHIGRIGRIRPFDPFESLQPSGQHQRQHFPITHERPERVPECCRAVLFNEEMRGPRKGITWHQGERKQPPPAVHDEKNEKTNRDQGAGTVQQAGGQLAVFTQVIGPEIRK